MTPHQTRYRLSSARIGRGLARAMGLGLAMAPWSCNSTGVGNPISTELAIVSDDQPETSSIDPTEQLAAGTVEEAILVIKALSWVPCDPSTDRHWAVGPFVVDLVRGSIQPNLPPIDVEAGQRLCGIDAWLGPASEPAWVSGRSLLFGGTQPDGTTFLLFVDLPGVLRVRTSDPAGVLPDTTNPDFVWALRPRRWLTPDELSGALPVRWLGSTRVLVIDRDHPLLLAAIKARLAGRSTLHVDSNHNRTLDPAERAEVIGRGLDSIE